MKLAGFLLLLAGWLLILAAIALLNTPVPRALFVVAGLGVEVFGLVVAFRAHPLPRHGGTR